MKTFSKLLCTKIMNFGLILILCSCNNTVKQTDRKTEMEAVKTSIHATIGWAKNKDFNLLYNNISNDSDYLEVDPGSRLIRGFDQFKKNETFWGNPEFKAIRYDIRDLKINLSENGDVAWFFCMLDDINEWKGQPACWMNTRWTGVLEKRKGKWTMVQMHFSFAKD
jgi:ketosteroid isomerase-like protein